MSDAAPLGSAQEPFWSKQGQRHLCTQLYAEGIKVHTQGPIRVGLFQTGVVKLRPVSHQRPSLTLPENVHELQYDKQVADTHALRSPNT